MTLLLAAVVAKTTADISLNNGYNNNIHQQAGIVQELSPQSLQSHLQFLQKPQQNYLPSQPKYESNFSPMRHLPMPNSFPYNFQATPYVQRARRTRPRSRVRIPKRPIVTKNFFIHSAPEESEDEIQDELAQFAQQPRKHYNVLFVKAPTQTNKAAALNLAKSLKEEKTVVYVLAKKTTAADLQDAIQDAPQHINKPDVFFIKYRTPEEAANAQRQIQTQYDSLGGSSTITDEGAAPITSVIGSLDEPEEDEIDELEQQQQQQQVQDQNQQQQQQYDHANIDGNGGDGGAAGDNKYLPPSQY